MNTFCLECFCNDIVKLMHKNSYIAPRTFLLIRSHFVIPQNNKMSQKYFLKSPAYYKHKYLIAPKNNVHAKTIRPF